MNEIRKPISAHCVCDCCNNGNNNYNQHGRNKSIDPAHVAQNFFSEYYRKVSNIGWNATTYLFDHNCNVIIKNKSIGNSYDMLNVLSSEYIKRANYDNMRTKWIVLSKDKMLLSAFGQIQLVSFNGHVSKIMPFNETFVLTGYPDGNIKCTQHLIDF